MRGVGYMRERRMFHILHLGLSRVTDSNKSLGVIYGSPLNRMEEKSLYRRSRTDTFFSSSLSFWSPEDALNFGSCTFKGVTWSSGLLFKYQARPSPDTIRPAVPSLAL